MPKRKPPHTHREIVKSIINANRIIRQMEGKPDIVWLPDWLKVELYNLFMIILPLLITVLIWLAIIASIYWYLLP